MSETAILIITTCPRSISKKAAEADGYDVTVTAVTRGGAYLYQHADQDNEQGKRLRQEIRGVHYDVAVIQEQSLMSLFIVAMATNAQIRGATLKHLLR